MKKMLLFLVLSGLLLTGCATSAPEMEIVSVKVPPPLLVCGPEPVPPDGESAREVGIYILDLREYGVGCESNLNAIAALQEGS